MSWICKQDKLVEDVSVAIQATAWMLQRGSYPFSSAEPQILAISMESHLLVLTFHQYCLQVNEMLQ